MLTAAYNLLFLIKATGSERYEEKEAEPRPGSDGIPDDIRLGDTDNSRRAHCSLPARSLQFWRLRPSRASGRVPGLQAQRGPGTTAFITTEGICSGELPLYVSSFNGGTSYVNATSPSGLAGSGSICSWFYPSASQSTSSAYTIADFGTAGSNTHELDFLINGGRCSRS